MYECSPKTARISGAYGDLFMTMKDILNFTFSLTKPAADNTWGEGNSSDGNKLLWLLAEGAADVGVGHFTPAGEISSTVDWVVGNAVVEKQFFIGTSSSEDFNFLLFLQPLTWNSWVLVLLSIICSAVLLFLAIYLGKDSQNTALSMEDCLAFSFSGITFIQRWSTTPSSLSARILFITILGTGILVQGFWKGEFTSFFSIARHPVPFHGLHDMLGGGVLPLVHNRSDHEDDFKLAKKGPFQAAWDLIKINDKHHFETIDQGIQLIKRNQFLALYADRDLISQTPEYQTCQIEAVPGTYFRRQVAMPVRKNFPFLKLFNRLTIKLRETGVQDSVFQPYKTNRGKQHCDKRLKGISLSWTVFVSAFCVFFVGFALSICICLAELLNKRISGEKQRKQPKLTGGDVRKQQLYLQPNTWQQVEM